MTDSSRPALRLHTYTTAGGVVVQRTTEERPYAGAGDSLLEDLDTRRGVLLASSFEYPGRYTRWDLGFVDPPLAFTARDRRLEVRAGNRRGEALLPTLEAHLAGEPHLASLDREAGGLVAEVAAGSADFSEEERSRQPTLFSLLRRVIALFASDQDPYLGLYGAFGYELAFQFEPIRLARPRDEEQRDLVLYLPDEVLVVDHRAARARTFRYDFAAAGETTLGRERGGEGRPYRPGGPVAASGDHAPGEYADSVRLAREAFARGDLFEVVPGQTFHEASPAPPSEVFRRLRARNPAPYGALLNLGDGEYLVAASPEMYVRVEGRRVETCPISGTIARGRDAIEDAHQIFTLLSSEKETSELTMCTDVDRNDKSRVCEPGSVRVIGRRQIEIYSRLIHTVDHVEGTLREEFDALDAFLAHTWAVTVTGAPKRAAIQFIEDHEKSPRRWYGGAIGMLGFNGNMNTGLTLRTVRIADGVAEVRAGATLLFDSDPEAEEAETRLKAAALLDAIRRPDGPAAVPAATGGDAPGTGRRVLMIDHQDSFVHTLAAYLRETGAEVSTLRAGFSHERLGRPRPDLVVLSPGPGRPSDFALDRTIAAVLEAGLPLFGVCLGLQGIVEYFGGTLGVLETPMHGKSSVVRVRGGRLFAGLPPRFTAGRYHSLFADAASCPRDLEVTADTEPGIVMAVEHLSLPVAAVQFHPESILSLDVDVGRRLVANVVRGLARRPGTGAEP